MSLLPQQILPITEPIGKLSDDGTITVTQNWWLLFYNLCAQTIGTAGGGALSIATQALLDTPFIPAPDNPKNLIGLTPVNGISASYMRSDGTHALSQAIAPTWTAKHIFLADPATTGMADGPAIEMGLQVGTSGAPVTGFGPAAHFVKYSNVTSGDPVGYEGGALWASNYVAGTQTINSTAFSAYIETATGLPTTGNYNAIHAYAVNDSGSAAAVWGVWDTVHEKNTVTPAQVMGMEIDTVLWVDRSHQTSIPANSAAVGLWINNQANAIGAFNGTFAIGVTGSLTGGAGGAQSKWYTGLFNAVDSIVPGSTHEFIQLHGGSTTGNRICGIRLLNQFDSGIDLSGASYSGTNAPILLPNAKGLVSVGGAGGGFNVIFLNSSNQVVLGSASGAGTLVHAPASGNIGLNVTGIASSYAAQINGDPTTNDSFGLQIQAGTSSTDTPFQIQNQTGGSTFVTVSGVGKTTLTPSSGQALLITATANNYGEEIDGNSTVGQSLGLLIKAGTNSSDRTILAQNQAASATFFQVRGDGSGTAGPTATLGFQWAASGAFTIAVPSAADALTVNAAGGHNALVTVGTGAGTAVCRFNTQAQAGANVITINLNNFPGTNAGAKTPTYIPVNVDGSKFWLQALPD